MKFPNKKKIRWAVLLGLCLLIIPACTASRVCFYDYPANSLKKLYSAIKIAPDTNRVKRIDGTCKAADQCLCYSVKYKGNAEDLKAWLDKELGESITADFKIKPCGGNCLNVYFDPAAKNIKSNSSGSTEDSGSFNSSDDKGFD